MKKNIKNINIHNRFDIFFKYMYIISKKNQHKNSFYEEAYKKHIKIWNNFLEYDDKTKNNYQEFSSRFDKLIELFENNMQSNLPSVPIKNNNLLNGSHRAACSLYFGKELNYFESQNTEDGQIDCSYNFLKGLSREGEKIDDYFFDEAAIVASEVLEDCKAICLFPSATKFGKINEVRNILDKYGIIYEKKIYLNSLGSLNLMKELYKDEEWAELCGRAGYQTKASLCFDNFENPMIIFLARIDISDCPKIKNDIRQLYGLGKHSVHINDFHEETQRITKAVLNKNSVHFLNNAKPSDNFRKMFRFFQEIMKNEKEENKNFCITSSMVLSSYGLREAKDIDYLFLKNPLNFENNFISPHNKYIESFYPLDAKELLTDPRNYYYHHGYKFLSLKNIENMKIKRGEEKDLYDLQKIKEVIS